MSSFGNVDFSPFSVADMKAHFQGGVNALAGPGYLGFKGGVMNPSVCVNGDVGFLLGKGVVCHWTKAKWFKSGSYLKGSPVLFKVDKAFNVEGSSRLDFVGYPQDQDIAIEDFRLFKYFGRLFVGHPVVTLLRSFGRTTYKHARQAISEVIPDSQELKFLGFPSLDFELNAIEKNWLYFELNGDLYVIYSVSPLHILKLKRGSNFEFETCIKDPFRLDRLSGLKGLSLSAGPVRYDDDSLLLIVHKYWVVDGRRVYFHWAVLLDVNNFSPKRVSRYPILSGGAAQGDYPGILYVMGVHVDDDSVVFGIGESDSYSGVLSISRIDFDSIWI